MITTHHFNDYQLNFEQGVRCESFDEGYCYGFRIYDENNIFEIINSCVGERLIIKSVVNMGEYKDLPWNLSTAQFLPNGINVRIK